MQPCRRCRGTEARRDRHARARARREIVEYRQRSRLAAFLSSAALRPSCRRAQPRELSQAEALTDVAQRRRDALPIVLGPPTRLLVQRLRAQASLPLAFGPCDVAERIADASSSIVAEALAEPPFEQSRARDVQLALQEGELTGRGKSLLASLRLATEAEGVLGPPTSLEKYPLWYQKTWRSPLNRSGSCRELAIACSSARRIFGSSRRRANATLLRDGAAGLFATKSTEMVEVPGRDAS